MKSRINGVIKFLKKHVFSMKFLIVLMIVITTIIPLIVIKNVVLGMYSSRQISRLETELQNRCNLLASDIIKSDYLTNRKNARIDAAIEQITYTYSGRVVIVSSNYMVVEDTYIERENKFLISEEVNKAFNGITTKNYNRESGYVELAVPIYTADGKNIKGVILITAPDTEVTGAVNYIDSIMTRASELTMLVVFIIAFLFAFELNRPLKRVATMIKNFTSGYPDMRLEENNGLSEVNEVSIEVNKMLDRLKNLDDSRQEFVSNVSHELKTPITSIKVLADSLNGQTDVPVELYQEFMSDIVEEIDRENKIINDLLSLVKMDKKAAGINVAPHNMNELVEHVLKRLKPIAEENDIDLILESFRPVVAEVDEVKISLVITNLVENAIKYNVANGWVRVSLNADYKFFYLTVADSGIGIPEESREMIFERFYRVDKARSRQTGGTGLGLAITKNAIMMHNGEIKVYSKEGEGSTFTIRIPLMYNKERVNV